MYMYTLAMLSWLIFFLISIDNFLLKIFLKKLKINKRNFFKQKIQPVLAYFFITIKFFFFFTFYIS